MPWLKSYYLILVVLFNKSLISKLLQLKINLRSIILTIIICNIYAKLLKVL